MLGYGRVRVRVCWGTGLLGYGPVGVRVCLGYGCVWGTGVLYNLFQFRLRGLKCSRLHALRADQPATDQSRQTCFNFISHVSVNTCVAQERVVLAVSA